MPRNNNLGTSALRNRKRVTKKSPLHIVLGNIQADTFSFEEDEEEARIASTAGVDAEDANEHHLRAVLSAASRRHQSAGHTRGVAEKVAEAPVAYIPTPDSTGLVENYADLYLADRWVQPRAYIRSSETVEEAVLGGLVGSWTYYMDEADKEWVDQNNKDACGEGTDTLFVSTAPSCPQRSAKTRGNLPESVQAVSMTEDEFELVMGIFEKVTYDKIEFLHHGLESGMNFPPFSDYQDVFSFPLPPSLFASFIVPAWIPPPAQLLHLAKLIYPHWKERRIERGGHRIIPVLNSDEADLTNESYVCFRHREFKSVRKTRASQTTSLDKLLRLQSELAQSLDLARALLAREDLKKENAEQVMQVWVKRLDFAEIKRKLPTLGTKEEDELLYEKERVVKKPRVEATNRITGLKIRTKETVDLGATSLQTDLSIHPRERLRLINAAIERDLSGRKDQDQGYDDIFENSYQRRLYPYPRRLWKAMTRSLGPSLPDAQVDERDIECLRHLRRRLTRFGNTMIDRRDVFSRRHGFCLTPHRGFGWPWEEVSNDNDEDMRRLRERWRFDEDNDPISASEGMEEQDRVLVDDYSASYLRHSMTLLGEADQRHITNDATLKLVSMEGRPQSVLPIGPSAQQPLIRRDAQILRSFANGTSPLSAVLTTTHAHTKALQPQSTTARTTALRPPRPPQTANLTPASPLSQTPPPHVTATAVSLNGAGGPASPASAPSDVDSVNLAPTPNGNFTKSITTNGTNSDARSPPTAESQLVTLTAGSPMHQKADVQHPVSIPLNGYHIPFNGYTAAYMHSRPPNGLTSQQMQNLRLALQGRDVNAIYGTNGRPYVGPLVPNGTHYDLQIATNLKLASGRQRSGAALPLQQAPLLGNPQVANTTSSLGSPNLTRTSAGVSHAPSASTGNVSRPGTVASSVGNMMPCGQSTSHSPRHGSPPLPKS